MVAAPELSADEVECGYNNRAAVPDHARWFARWGELSAAAYASERVVRDLRYGPGPKETLDLFAPRTPARATFLFLHGGYWRSLDKAEHAFVAPPLTARGIVVAVANYDLCPGASIAAIVEETARAVAWLVREGGGRGANTGRLVVGGHSAGGHLAAMSACALWPQWDPDLPADLVAGVVSVSGLYDLEPLRHTTFLGPDLALDEAGAFRASPAWMTPATGAPVVTAAGGLESESFKAQSALLAQRWPRNVVADLPMPGRNHLTVVDALAEPGNPLFEAALGLCRGA